MAFTASIFAALISFIIAPRVKALWCYACTTGCQARSVCYTTGQCYVAYKDTGYQYGCIREWPVSTRTVQISNCLFYQSPFRMKKSTLWCFCSTNFCNSKRTIWFRSKPTASRSARQTTTTQPAHTISGRYDVTPTAPSSIRNASRSVADRTLLSDPVTTSYRQTGTCGYFTNGVTVSPTTAVVVPRDRRPGSVSREEVAYWMKQIRSYELSKVYHCGDIYKPSTSSKASNFTNIPCPDGFEYHVQRQCCYTIVRRAYNQSQAQKYCQSHLQGAALVSLETISEYRCIAERIDSEPELLFGWRGWWTSGIYDEKLREFVWSNSNAVISRLDLRWLAPLLRLPYERTCVWLVPQAKMRFGNYFCGQESGFICEITL